jgi:hypothetical protein
VVLSCAHTFESFRVPGASNLSVAAQVDESTSKIHVQFVDGQTANAFLAAIDWGKDLSLLMVLMRDRHTNYRPVKFIDPDCAAMGFSAHQREARVYSIVTFPVEQPEALFGTALAGKIWLVLSSLIKCFLLSGIQV